MLQLLTDTDDAKRLRSAAGYSSAPSDEATRVTREVAAGYASTYAAPKSTLVRISREVYGAEISDVAPVGPLSMDELHRVARGLEVGPGQRFVDLGCGPGGPALWLVRETGASALGVDIVPEAIAKAIERARAMGLEDRTHFQVGDATATGLQPGAFDGSVSINTLLFIADKRSGIAEMARIVRPGGRSILLTWESELPFPGLAIEPVSDHRPLLRDAGLEVEVHEVMPDRSAEHRAFAEAIVAAERELVEEMGEEAGGREVRIARRLIEGAYPPRRRVLIACRVT